MMRLLVIILLFAAPGICAASAATAPSSEPADVREPDGADLRISVITMSPGDAAWEKFGHIALRIQDPSARYPDVAFNWGMFDFAQKNFFLNFIQGRMRYSSGVEYTQPMLADYTSFGRAIWEQELNLSPHQKLALAARCNRSIDPANREYLYNYYEDNCATRVRDQIDAAIGGAIARQTRGVPTGTSFRWHTRRLTAGSPWLYISLQTLLGHPADRPIDAWEEMFLPGKLREHLRHITITDDLGGTIPLVREERLLSAGSKPPERDRPPNTVAAFVLTGLIGGGLMVWLSRSFRPASPGSKRSAMRTSEQWAFRLLANAWLLLVGVGGVCIVWSWFFTDHAHAANNETLLQITPLAFVLLFSVNRLTWSGRRAPAARTTALIISGLALFGLVIKVLPWFREVNYDIIALALPMHLAMAWVVWRLTKVSPNLQSATLPMKTETGGA